MQWFRIIPFYDGGSGLFLVGEWRAVRGDYNEILGWLSMEGDPKNIGYKIGRCYLENKL